APPPAPPPPSVLAQIGGLKDKAGPPKKQHAGRPQALVDQGDRTLPPRLGQSVPHKGLVLVGTRQLNQQNLIGNLRCSGRQPLFKLQHLLGSVWKGLCKQGFKRGEWMRVSMGVLMPQGQHRLGRLFRGSELLHTLKLCLSWCYVTPRATPFAQTHPAGAPRCVVSACTHRGAPMVLGTTTQENS